MNAYAHVMLFRLALELAVACAVVVALPPVRPLPAALACSLAAGVCVALAAARRLPNPADLRGVTTRRFVPALYLSLRAFAEETLWRGLVFGLALPRLGLVPAAALSLIGFVLIHVPGQGRFALVHLLTGAAFLTCYLTAGLWAAVLAHVAYNLTCLTLAPLQRRALRPT
ncbi:MAG: CPBP family intramembrane glutamic endopeptidase [Vulcanimicrobiaceae bacterium]